MPDIAETLAGWKAERDAATRGVASMTIYEGMAIANFMRLLAAVESVLALCDEREEASVESLSRMFGGDPFPAFIGTHELRQAITAALGGDA